MTCQSALSQSYCLDRRGAMSRGLAEFAFPQSAKDVPRGEEMALSHWERVKRLLWQATLFALKK